ncbi:hypothetical protein Ahy_A07g035625 isoform D [Arachis hypogaea]|uniref:CRAL-TRIO domain-containing protein n=1 Tax=Arachis hypogaea TaxID=3818 RepID=A0A445CE77_ARAHY|nr:hypothetical protein Ahy_A07g035625 isoform D [Arachis hypogaea]
MLFMISNLFFLGVQNSKSIKGQVKYLVYCMENAILNLPPHQEQMVWLIDFQGFNLSHISVRVTRETAHILQDQYPERLGLAILYNPPKFFEPFFTVIKLFPVLKFHPFDILTQLHAVVRLTILDSVRMVKPLLEPKTYNKVKFVYADDNNTKKIMEDLFDLDQLESAFGGKNDTGFDINRYAERMKEDDKKIPSFWTGENSLSSVPVAPPSLDSIKLDSDSDPSDNEKRESSPDLDPDPRMDTEIVNHNDDNVLVNQEYGNARVDTH